MNCVLEAIFRDPSVLFKAIKEHFPSKSPSFNIFVIKLKE